MGQRYTRYGTEVAMRRGRNIRGLSLLLSAGLALVMGAGLGRGDEPRGLGRFFRIGGNNAPARGGRGASPEDLPAGGSQSAVAVPAFPGGPAATPVLTDTGANQRIRPQPRITRPATDADPILTEVSLARTDDGKSFGMFVQVYADGTVIDGEGVHRVSATVLRPLAQVIQSGELHRNRGFCGGASADFVEQVQLVVYERSLGRLRAIHLGYAGDAQTCDPAVRELHAALKALKEKLSGPATIAPPGAPTALPAPVDSPAPSNAPLPPVAPEGPDEGPTIPLTPGA